MRGSIRIGERKLYRFGNVLLLALIALFGTGRFLGVENPGGWHVLVVLMVLLFLLAVHFLSGQKKWFFLLAVFICFGFMATAIGIKQTGAFLRSYMQWLAGSEGVPIAEEAQAAWRARLYWYGLLQTGLITIVCYLLQLLLEQFPAVKNGFAVLLLTALVVCLLTRTELGHLGMALLTGYLVMVAMEGIESHWNKVRKRSQRAYLIWISPFLAGYVLLLFSMPVPKEPYDWSWVQKLYTQIKESFVIAAQDAVRGDKEDFGVAFSGFSGERSLKEGVREKAQAVMSIQSEGKLRTNLYLSGRVYDTFDGRQWKQEAEGFPQERFLDTLETLYAARSFDEKHMRDYLGRTDLTIRYGYFNTQYVFQPLKLWELRGGRGLDFSDLGGDLVWKKKRGYGTEYQIEYFQINLGQPEFLRFLEEMEKTGQPEPSRDILWEQALLEYERRTGEQTDWETMEAYRQYVYDTYLPEAVVSQEKLSTSSKAETLLAIEQELSEFTYTRTPGKMPETVKDEESFLEYFLSESRQGYCTYFATAFALLARAAGIPARYVEGFLVPTQDTALYGREGELLVYSSMAHAWSEVYFEGIGWIPFEPTPGYGGLRYTPWATSQTVAGGEKEGVKQDGISGEHGQETNPSGYFSGEKEDSPPEKETPVEEEEQQVGIWGKLWSWKMAKRISEIAGLALAAVFVSGLLLLLLNRLFCRFRYRNMEPVEKLRVNLQWNLQILDWLGLSGKTSDAACPETLEELQKRGERLLEAEAVVLPLRFIGYYEEVVYGKRAVTEEMLEEAAKERQELLALLKRKKGWKYALYWWSRNQFPKNTYTNRNGSDT